MVGAPRLARETIGWVATRGWEETARDLLEDWRGRVENEPEIPATQESERGS